MISVKLFEKQKNSLLQRWTFVNILFLSLSYVLISLLLVVLFIPYSDGKNLSYGQIIPFGFYFLELHEQNNILSLNWFSLTLTILAIIDVCLCCYSFWIYKRSSYNVFIKKYTISFLYFFVILLLLFLLFLNFMNRDVINLRDKDIVKNGFWNDVNSNYEWLIFNYTYDIVLARYSNSSYVVNWVMNKFGIAWLMASVMLILAIFVSNLIYLYYKNKLTKGKRYGC